MIVVMKKNASTADVQHMVERIENLGLKPHVIVGTERTVIAAVGDDRKTHKESLESGAGRGRGGADPRPLQGRQPRGEAGADGRSRRQPDRRRQARSA